MGAQLVSLVFARWKHLNDTAFRILMRMALTALDQETDGRPPNLYFGGHDFLATALRRPFPMDDTEQARKARQNVLRDVRRAVKDLVDQGAIEGVETGRAIRQGEARTYRLTLWKGAGVLTPSSAGGENPCSNSSDAQSGTPPAGGENPSSAGGENPSSAGGENPHEQGVRTPPRRPLGTTEEPWEEDRAETGEQPQDARALDAEDVRPPLRSVPTQGVRDPVPPGGGVPGQQPFLAPVAAAETTEDPQAPHGRCEGCQRPLARNRPACLRCGLMIGEVS